MTSFSSYTHGVHGAPPIGPQMTNYGSNRLEAERQKIRKIFWRILFNNIYIAILTHVNYCSVFIEYTF